MPRLVFDQGGGDQQPVDLIQVRDVIMHLPLDHALNLLCNVLTSKARILVATTFPTGRNENIEEGTWYQNDLTARPFDFPSDVPCQQTHPNHAGDLTCIYDLTKPWVEEWIKAKNCPVVSD